MKVIRKRQFEFLGHIVRKGRLENCVLLGKLKLAKIEGDREKCS